MKSEHFESEIIKEEVAKLKFETNIPYSSVFNTISLMINQVLLDNPGSIVLMKIVNEKTNAVFIFDILNTAYEKNNQIYEEICYDIIREISLFNKKEVITNTNLLSKIPTIGKLVNMPSNPYKHQKM